MSKQQGLIAAESQCEACKRGEPVSGTGWAGAPMHSLYGTDESGAKWAMRGEFVRCKNYDSELRHIAEPLGFYTVAWLPKKCRNGQWRWLAWVEHHSDGSFTLGNRAG